MSKTVMVTGGSGFSGTWVVRALLERNRRPIVYEEMHGGALGQPPWIEYVRGDLLDCERLAQVFRRYPIDAVIRRAAWLTPSCQAEPYAIDGLFPDWQVAPLADGLRRTVAYYQSARTVPALGCEMKGN